MNLADHYSKGDLLRSKDKRDNGRTVIVTEVHGDRLRVRRYVRGLGRGGRYSTLTEKSLNRYERVSS